TSRRRRCGAGGTSPPSSRTPMRSSPSCATKTSGSRSRRTRLACSGCRTRKHERRRMSVTPRKDLGQHFLVDDNILRVIERLAELSADDVVLEIGPGRGILTRFLAARVAHVHAVEIDRSLEADLPSGENVELHWGDALALDLAALEPKPRKLI